ncbi:unnamed protein product, partial [Aphanomyces euteiches]
MRFFTFLGLATTAVVAFQDRHPSRGAVRTSGHEASTLAYDTPRGLLAAGKGDLLKACFGCAGGGKSGIYRRGDSIAGARGSPTSSGRGRSTTDYPNEPQ